MKQTKPAQAMEIQASQLIIPSVFGGRLVRKKGTWMSDRESYSRRTTIAAAAFAWFIGLLTGVLGTRAYISARTTDGEPVAPTPAPAAAVAAHSPAPEAQESVIPMQVIFNKTCPQITVEKVRTREANQERLIQITFRMNNPDPDRTCSLGQRSLLLRDGHGQNHNHEPAEKLVFPPLSSRRVHLAYRVPKATDLVKLVIGDPRSPEGTLDLDFAKPFGR